MRIIRLTVEVAVPTCLGMEYITDEEIENAVEIACSEADNCLAAEVMEVRRVEVMK